MNKAKVGDFVKDLSTFNRSMGFVSDVNESTGMMLVKFPKIGRNRWLLWENFGHYVVIK